MVQGKAGDGGREESGQRWVVGSGGGGRGGGWEVGAETGVGAEEVTNIIKKNILVVWEAGSSKICVHGLVLLDKSDGKRKPHRENLPLPLSPLPPPFPPPSPPPPPPPQHTQQITCNDISKRCMSCYIKCGDTTSSCLTTSRVVINPPAVKFERAGIGVDGDASGTKFRHGSLECRIVVLGDKSEGVNSGP